MFHEYYLSQLPDTDPDETHEWLEALNDVIQLEGHDRARYLLKEILYKARDLNIGLPPLTSSPYINTIPPEEEPKSPGDQKLEKTIRRIIRWNAMAMVQRANKRFPGLGGHLSTYASSASLYETGFNHFFRGREAKGGGDQLFIQGHTAPGIYARAFLEGRLSEDQLDHFRRETSGQGLSSYPHPWLMPDFWQFPTVSMGLGAIGAIYQARFNRYIHDRGLKDTSDQRVWAFLGDGEMDEPESQGALTVASRHNLDNLIFVVNCNLQRLDGPVRGNGKIIQELERLYRGAGWHVIKVIWGPEWNELLSQDVDGLLVERMNTVPDGQFQKYSVETGAYIRQDFFGTHPKLLKMVEHLSDRQIEKLRRGGHSYRKLYAAYQAATEHKGQPVAILCKTVKGWTLGDSFAGSNVTHQLKKLSEEQLRKFRDTLHLDIPDSRLSEAPYYHPGKDSEIVQYILQRRAELGGPLPARVVRPAPLKAPEPKLFEEFFEAPKGRAEVSTTMVFVRLLRNLLRHKTLGAHIVPIIPDEARTFGMDPLFREVGIYSPVGQTYDPVDSKLFLNYHEAKDGQLLEEGITEAGSMASYTAAGTSYATHGLTTIPFYIFYSMFGLQRTGDQAWAFGDARGRGFLLGATAGRTTLNGEGLQHEDGHSHLFAQAIPNMLAYDPAFGFEVAFIIEEGLRRMLENDEDISYYITLYNENYAMPSLPGPKKDIREGVLKGMYLLQPGAKRRSKKETPRVQLWGSGPLIHAALEAQKILSTKYGVDSDVWSITSYQQLYRQARSVERHNRLHPGQAPQTPYVAKAMESHRGPIVATLDWVSEIPSLVARFIDRGFYPLGANGFGLSDTREALRAHFEIDARWMAYTALYALMNEGAVEAKVIEDALGELGIDPAKSDPFALS
jgi:pyruvate dehydrogenase E1 component